MKWFFPEHFLVLHPSLMGFITTASEMAKAKSENLISKDLTKTQFVGFFQRKYSMIWSSYLDNINKCVKRHDYVFPNHYLLFLYMYMDFSQKGISLNLIILYSCFYTEPYLQPIPSDLLQWFSLIYNLHHEYLVDHIIQKK